MTAYVQDSEGITIRNSNFRQVLYPAKFCQRVVMSLKPEKDIGEEVHRLDPFFRLEQDSGLAVLDGARTPIAAGFSVVLLSSMTT